MIVVPITQLVERLENELSSLGTLTLGLFVVDVSPDINTELAALLVDQPAWCEARAMAGFSGAGAVGPVAQATWDAMVFTNDLLTEQDVYGYYVADAGGTFIRWSERSADAPVTVPPGGTYTVLPYYSRKNQV